MKPHWPLLLFLLFTVIVQAADPPAKRIWVVAHRGAHDHAPENSVAAIQAAVGLGCDFVEIDVRTTRDHHLVLMHDSTVDRTTTGKGSVSELTLAEIRQLRFGAEWPTELVPTLEEALAACKGKLKIYIDHKDASPADVLTAVKKHEMLADVIVYGSVETLREYKRIHPTIWIMPPHPGNAEKIKTLVADLKPETLDGNIAEWTVEQAKAAHAAGAQVWVDNPVFYDSEWGVLRAIELNVDGIQTDQPERLLDLLRSHGLH